MSRSHNNGAPSGAGSEAPGPGEEQYQRLWFALAPRPWSSLLLVPADERASADEVARRVGAVGKQLSSSPVTVVTAGSLDYGTATALADLPGYLQQARQRPGRWGSAIEMPPSTLSQRDEPGERQEAGAAGVEPAQGQALQRLPFPDEAESSDVSGARLIISVPPVISLPLGLAVAHSADLVVLVVELGRSRVVSVQKTVDLIGRDRVAGCFLVY